MSLNSFAVRGRLCKVSGQGIKVVLFLLLHSGKGTGLGGLTNSQSVSFRQGTNVEFGASSFPPNGPTQRGVSKSALRVVS